jgi:hypothetical protein
MRNYIRMGVDGIMVNDVETLRATVAEQEFHARLRLATQSDRPFSSPPAPAYILDVKTGDVGGGGTDALLRFFVIGPNGAEVVYRVDSIPPGLFEAGDKNRVTIFGDVGAPKEPLRNNMVNFCKSTCSTTRCNGVVPIAMKRVSSDVDFRHIGIAHLDSRFVFSFVQGRPNLQASASCCVRNQIHDDLAADERRRAPILGDVAEHAVFDLVPLARAWRKVAHGNRQSGLVRKLLKRELPQSRSASVAPAAIGGHQQLGCVWIRSPAHPSPPLAQGFHGELGGVMVHADADPSLVPEDVEDPIGERLPEFLIREVLAANQLGVAPSAPLLASVLEVAHQLLLLRIHRDDRQPAPLEPADHRVDVQKLGVAIRMREAFPGLPIRLKAVVHTAKQPTDNGIGDLISTSLQLLGELPCALARPTQGRLRMASGMRRDQCLKLRENLRALLLDLLPSRPWLPNSVQRGRRVPSQFAEPLANSHSRQPRRVGNSRHSAIPNRLRLGRRPAASQCFAQTALDRLVPASDGVLRRHDGQIAERLEVGHVISKRILSDCGCLATTAGMRPGGI